jgi:hypothetical protein
MPSNNSALSGGLLVALGIAIALGGVYFYTHFIDHPTQTITLTLPSMPK